MTPEEMAALPDLRDAVQLVEKGNERLGDTTVSIFTVEKVFYVKGGYPMYLVLRSSSNVLYRYALAITEYGLVRKFLVRGASPVGRRVMISITSGSYLGGALNIQHPVMYIEQFSDKYGKFRNERQSRNYKSNNISKEY
jgi:hypothetical protein